MCPLGVRRVVALQRTRRENGEQARVSRYRKPLRIYRNSGLAEACQRDACLADQKLIDSTLERVGMQARIRLPLVFCECQSLGQYYAKYTFTPF
jgi:hypothetical protein